MKIKTNFALLKIQNFKKSWKKNEPGQGPTCNPLHRDKSRHRQGWGIEIKLIKKDYYNKIALTLVNLCKKTSTDPLSCSADMVWE